MTTLESLINQTIDFERSIFLILVDDGLQMVIRGDREVAEEISK